MKSIIISLSFAIVFLISESVLAQESPVSSGGDFQGNDGSVSYSIGQITYNSIEGANAIVTEGVQQPFEIFINTNIENPHDINLSVSVFPNPTTDYLTLSVSDYNNMKLSYTLMDAQGRIIEEKKITKCETKITFYNKSKSTYFLIITEDGVSLKTFTIVKK